jgi:hypothetical protein
MIERHLRSSILAALSDAPVVLVNGARQVGKSTLVREITAGDHPARYYTLDDAGVLSAALADPAGFLAGTSGPIVIDEVQRAPELFLAIKAEVDRNRQPGRFLALHVASRNDFPRTDDPCLDEQSRKETGQNSEADALRHRPDGTSDRSRSGTTARRYDTSGRIPRELRDDGTTKADHMEQTTATHSSLSHPDRRRGRSCPRGCLGKNRGNRDQDGEDIDSGAFQGTEDARRTGR